MRSAGTTKILSGLQADVSAGFSRAKNWIKGKPSPEKKPLLSAAGSQSYSEDLPKNHTVSIPMARPVTPNSNAQNTRPSAVVKIPIPVAMPVNPQVESKKIVAPRVMTKASVAVQPVQLPVAQPVNPITPMHAASINYHEVKESSWSRNGEKVKSCLTEFKRDISKQCTKAKNWVAEKMDSENALRLKVITRGALKATAGVYPILDLILSFIPATAPCYLGFKIAKYLLTVLALILSAYSSYKRNKNNRSFNSLLEEKLIEAQKISVSSEQIALREEELLKEAGYPNDRPKQELLAHTSNEEIPIPTGQKSRWTLCAESKYGIYARSLINGAINASTVCYVLDLFSDVIPITKAFEIIKQVLIWLAFVWGTLKANEQIRGVMESLAKIIRLESQISCAEKKLESIEKHLGTPEELVKLAEYGASITNGSLQVVVPDVKDITDKSIIPKSTFTRIAESKPGIYGRTIVNGVKKAVGVSYVTELLIPELPELKIAAGIVTFALAGYGTYKKIHLQLSREKKLEQLQHKVARSNQVVEVAKGIVRIEEMRVKELIANSSVQRDSYQEQDPDEVLLTPYDEMDQFSRQGKEHPLFAVDEYMFRSNGPTQPNSVVFDANIELSALAAPAASKTEKPLPRKPSVENRFFGMPSVSQAETTLLLSGPGEYHNFL